MANQETGTQQKAKCGHEGCTCLVEPSQSYCSEYCARETTSGGSANLPGGKHNSSRCECGHSECQAPTA